MRAKWLIDKIPVFTSCKEPRKRNVLLVDSERFCRGLLGLLLTEKGYNVAFCGDIIEALNLIERKPFDFVITAHSEPFLDGLLLLRKIKQYNSSIPVLILSSRCDQEPYLEAMDSGALDLITKPSDYSEFLRLVNTYC